MKGLGEVVIAAGLQACTRSTGSPRAVRNSTGVLFPCSRRVRHTPKPSIPGNITSSTMSAQACSRSQASARSPSPAVLTS